MIYIDRYRAQIYLCLDYEIIQLGNFNTGFDSAV